MIKNALFYLFKVIVGLFINLYCSRVVLQALGVEDFGIYVVVSGIAMIATFINGAMSSATLRYFSMSTDNVKFNNIYISVINMYILITLFVFIVLYFAKYSFFHMLDITEPRYESALLAFDFSLLSFVFIMLLTPFNAILLAKEKAKFYFISGVSASFLKLFLVIVLINNDSDKLVIYSLFVMLVSLFQLIIVYLYVKLRISYLKYKCAVYYSEIRVVASFIGWSLFGNLASTGYNQGLSVLLNIYFGTIINAARGISDQVNNSMLNIVSGLSNAINPKIMQHYAYDKINLFHDLTINGARYLFLFCLLFVTLISVNCEFALSLWLSSFPDKSVTFVQLVLFNSLINSLSFTLMFSIQSSGKIKYYQLTLGCVLLLNLPLSFLGTFIFNYPEFVFVIMILISVFCLALRLAFASYLVQLPIRRFFFETILRCLLVGLLVFILSILIENEFGPDFFSLFCQTIFCIIFIFTFGLNKNERSYIFIIIKKLIIK
ncbi:hypothetical protein A9261_12780 [Vibrio tasmaniensis]|nr:hypothetical protein A9261_12780 [Vibrio tasmaniensis]